MLTVAAFAISMMVQQGIRQFSNKIQSDMSILGVRRLFEVKWRES